MAGEAAIGFSVYAALEADEARQAAERAEARAFMDGYCHRAATPEERHRYITVVREMYPESQAKVDPAMNAFFARCFGGAIVLAFLLIGGGAIYGHFVHGDANQGAENGAFVIGVSFLGLILLGLFCLGLALLFGALQ